MILFLPHFILLLTLASFYLLLPSLLPPSLCLPPSLLVPPCSHRHDFLPPAFSCFLLSFLLPHFFLVFIFCSPFTFLLSPSCHPFPSMVAVTGCSSWMSVCGVTTFALPSLTSTTVLVQLTPPTSQVGVDAKYEMCIYCQTSLGPSLSLLMYS